MIYIFKLQNLEIFSKEQFNHVHVATCFIIDQYNFNYVQNGGGGCTLVYNVKIIAIKKFHYFEIVDYKLYFQSESLNFVKKEFRISHRMTMANYLNL